MDSHALVISKALYRLCTSGNQFHKAFTDTLHIERFTLCKADSDVWMQHKCDTYEYVAVYVDDLLCAMRHPRSFLNHLIQVHKYELMGDEPLSFSLGCDFGCNPGRTCYYQPKKYMSKILSTYECMFPGESLKKQSSSIVKGDHPELDDVEFVSEEDKAKYMSMISTAQWPVTLGRLAIAITMSTLSSYR